ncbi:MAG TPA: hypothetical protein VHS96_02530 [Bacteroidia bacterium]|nr:hypothetical protein [Bacteroidia bacterium]
MLHASSGVSAGGPSEKFVVANRFINDGVTRETVDWAKLGFITDRWRNGGKGHCGNGEGASQARAVRRYRVWVHVAEVVSTSLSPRDKVYELAEGQRMHASGFVTDWVQNMRHPSECLEPGWTGWSNMKIDLRGLLDGIEDGTFVLFTGIEVAEKRGRHWVRLPWCCRMEVSGVIEVEGSAEMAVTVREVVPALRLAFGDVWARDGGVAGLAVAPLELVAMDLGP